MTGFLLDVQIEELQFSGYLHTLHPSVWLLLKADGVHQTIRGPQMSTLTTARFQFPCRLVLNLPCLEGYWFKTSLWSFDPNQSRQIAIASAQVRLENLPKSQFQRFSYPLLNVQNPKVTAAMVTATAAIRPIALGPGPPLIPGQSPDLRPRT
jgi:hypothetical protein